MNAYNKQYGYNQLLLHSANNACAMYIFSLTRARCVFKTPCVFFEKIHCKDMKFPKFSTICFRKKFDFLRFFDFSSFFLQKQAEINAVSARFQPQSRIISDARLKLQPMNMENKQRQLRHIIANRAPKKETGNNMQRAAFAEPHSPPRPNT